METGAGLGLRQGEAFGLSLEDFDFDFDEGVVHIRRQIKMVRASLCFALPKGRKVRDVALPSSIGEAARRYADVFPSVPVTMAWNDPRPPETPVEAKHRRPSGNPR